jgi:hypothetical protein
MLKWIRDARLDFKTGVVVLVLALVLWGIVTWARVSDFVPAELRESPAPAPAEEPVRVP